MNAHPLDQQRRVPDWKLQDDYSNRPAKKARLTYTCQACGKHFTEKRSLTRHCRENGGCTAFRQPASVHTCPHCDKSFRRKENVVRHINESHLGLRRASTRREFTFTSLSPPEASNQVATSYQSTIATAETLSNKQPSTPCAGKPSDCCDGSACGELDTFTELNSLSQDDLWPSRGESVDSGLATSAGSHVFEVTPKGQSPDVDLNLLSKQFSKTWQRTSGAQDSSKAALLRSSKPCPLCSRPFGKTTDAVLAHLKRHSKEFQGIHWCHRCQISFQHRKDLVWHLQSALRGQCGFHFPHTEQCTGHHPPRPEQRFLNDNDRMSLHLRLKHWEQAKLQSYLVQVAELGEQPVQRRSAYIGRSAIGSIRYSFASGRTALTKLSQKSAPAHVDYDRRLDVEDVQRRLASLSILADSLPKPEPPPEMPDPLEVTVDEQGPRDSRLGEVTPPGTHRKVDVGDLATAGDVSHQQAQRPSIGTSPLALGHEETMMQPYTSPARSDREYVAQLQSWYPIPNHRSKRACDSAFRQEMVAAASLGDVSCVETLLSNGAMADRASLLTAAQAGHTRIEELLLSGMAGQISGSQLVESLLEIAAYRGHRDMVFELLSRGRSDCHQLYGNALAAASVKGHLDIVRLLVSPTGGVSPRSERAGTAVYAAQQRGHEDVTQLLTSVGARLDGECYQMLHSGICYCAHERSLTILEKAWQQEDHVHADTCMLYAGTRQCCVKA